jgi:hypothetical protein
MQYQHYKACLDIFNLKPSQESREFAELVSFVAQVSWQAPHPAPKTAAAAAAMEEPLPLAAAAFSYSSSSFEP